MLENVVNTALDALGWSIELAFCVVAIALFWPMALAKTLWRSDERASHIAGVAGCSFWWLWLFVAAVRWLL